MRWEYVNVKLIQSPWIPCTGMHCQKHSGMHDWINFCECFNCLNMSAELMSWQGPLSIVIVRKVRFLRNCQADVMTLFWRNDHLQMSWKLLSMKWNRVKLGTTGYQYNIYGVPLTLMYSRSYLVYSLHLPFFQKYHFENATPVKPSTLMILFQPNFL